MMKKNKKIAVFGVKTVPYTGGIENVVENTLPNLVGFEKVVYVRKKYFNSETLPNVRLICLPHLYGKTFEAFSHTLISIFHALFIEKASIFFFHAVVLGLFTPIPRLFGKKVVLQTHGLDWKREKWGWMTKLLIKISTFLSGIVPNATLCVGREDQLYFKEKFKKEFPLVPNGVRIPDFNKNGKILEELKLEKNKYFLFMARLVREKGAHILIEAFNSFKNEINNNDIKLVIAGDTNYKDKYYEFLLNHKSESIIFPGFINGDDKFNLLVNALCLIQPSSIEGMSIGILESMALGTLPIVSDIPENSNLVNKFGLIFKSNDSEDLKTKLFQVYTGKFKLDKLEMISYVSKNFSWDSSIQKLQDILESLS